MSAIYTRLGDTGHTAIRKKDKGISKASLYPKVCGYFDELNVFIGWIITTLSDDVPKKKLHEIQRSLFEIPNLLDCCDRDEKKLKEINGKYSLKIKNLENEIDLIYQKVPPLKEFLYPGKNEISVRWHMARVICRHAERALVEFSNAKPVPKSIIAYMNRLSDWFFIYAYASEVKITS